VRVITAFLDRNARRALMSVGRMVGMEVLDARSHLPPDALAAAE
jgi:hypothetical protein